jgi:hypothetical protein
LPVSLIGQIQKKTSSYRHLSRKRRLKEHRHSGLDRLPSSIGDNLENPLAWRTKDIVDTRIDNPILLIEEKNNARCPRAGENIAARALMLMPAYRVGEIELGIKIARNCVAHASIASGLLIIDNSVLSKAYETLGAQLCTSQVLNIFVAEIELNCASILAAFTAVLQKLVGLSPPESACYVLERTADPVTQSHGAGIVAKCLCVSLKQGRLS